MFNRWYSGIKQHLTKLQTQSDIDNNNTLTSTPTTQSCPPNLIPNQESTASAQPIAIGQPNGDAVRRRSSLFGISRNQHDDFVQKDLMASSWT
ncbi:hypothetical protein VKS41_001482 [Umbelopsis sp. WA50703]|jgi:hypothetical protein